jgi:hypothetical protein
VGDDPSDSTRGIREQMSYEIQRARLDSEAGEQHQATSRSGLPASAAFIAQLTQSDTVNRDCCIGDARGYAKLP